LTALKAEECPDLELVVFSAPQTDRALLENLRVRTCDRFRWSKSTVLRSAILLTVGAMLEPIDLFHGLEPSGYPFLYKARRSVVTIHDVTPVILPSAFPPRHRWILATAFARVRRQADAVIVPSAAAAEDVVRYLNIDRARITVIPLGCDPRFHPIVNSRRVEAVRQRYMLPARYALFVGTREPRKNLGVLLRAFARFRAECPRDDVKLAVAGGPGWGREPFDEMIDALKIRDQVLCIGFVADADLPDLYRGADMFVYPSLYEGFGLPVLEAMACGVPVITSDRSALPEVAGDAALLVDPTQPAALTAAMSTVMSDKVLREELRWKGISRAKDFTWEAVARKTLAVYRSVAGG
jgi:glycosyltransferase involved in cell wall biosynthesis